MKLHLHQELFEDAIRVLLEFFQEYHIYILKKIIGYAKYYNNYHTSQFTESTVFKGGTSLSKGYGLINRFSEDIDIAVITGGFKWQSSENTYLQRV